MTDLAKNELTLDEAAAVMRFGAASIRTSQRLFMDVVRELGEVYAVGEWHEHGSWEDYLHDEYGVPYRRTSPVSDTRPVYFIQAASGAIKIGVAADPSRRLADLQTAAAERLRLVAVVPNQGARGEAEHHAQFASARMHGEWFTPTAELLAYIAERGVRP